jgi:hypothetical protein
VRVETFSILAHQSEKSVNLPTYSAEDVGIDRERDWVVALEILAEPITIGASPYVDPRAGPSPWPSPGAGSPVTDP